MFATLEKYIIEPELGLELELELGGVQQG